MKSIEQKLSNHIFKSVKSGDQTAPKTPKQLLEYYTMRGEAGNVARRVLNHHPEMPDAEKRERVATAAKVEAQQALDRSDILSKEYVKSRVKKAKTVERSKKEGKALAEQLQDLYMQARWDH